MACCSMWCSRHAGRAASVPVLRQLCAGVLPRIGFAQCLNLNRAAAEAHKGAHVAEGAGAEARRPAELRHGGST